MRDHDDGHLLLTAGVLQELENRLAGLIVSARSARRTAAAWDFRQRAGDRHAAGSPPES